MARHYVRALAALIVPALAPIGPAQSMNNLVLHNGTDIFYYITDPSVGGPPGAFFAGGDWWWKVFPKEVMHDPLGVMELTGFVFDLYDGDWTTPPVMHDIEFTPGMPSLVTPGSIEPNFASPLAMLVAGGPFPGLAPLGCPPPGFIAGYTLEFVIPGAAAGPGLFMLANGLTDWTWVTFAPGGMTFAGPPLGACGVGDFTFQDGHSSPVDGGVGEQQPAAVVLAGGLNKYGGYHIGGTPPAATVAEPFDETYTGELEFRKPVTQPMINVGIFQQAGLASLNPKITGTSTLGMRLYASAQVGELGFFFGSFFPVLPAPGIAIFGINIMVNIADPVAGTLANLWSGPIAPVPNGGPPFDDGVVETAQIPLPITLIGTTLTVQGFTLGPGFVMSNSQVVTLPMF
ncbi:MAG TPA: hypothetical protein VKE69_06445 [Planctomycetota bacterium]|nr:hypothetical protein [Planctomycetota bacterium]